MNRTARRISRLLICCLLLLTFSSCKTPTAANSDGLVRNLTWAIGSYLPTASDFAGENPGTDYKFAASDPFKNLSTGENTVSIRVTDANGKTKTYQAVFTLVEDTEKPVISGSPSLIATVGQKGFSYWTGVLVTDNCDCPLTKSVNTDDVNFEKEGAYPVTYTVTDSAGNTSHATFVIYVYEDLITEEMLNERIDALIFDLGLSGRSKLDQCRLIYNYVHSDSTIHYAGNSNDSNRVSWVREAYLALENYSGDCYTYFALSKAFLVRLGIENLDVQRTAGLTKDTHFWSMVNLAEAGEAPRWYHFDATRLLDTIYNGGILTDAQVQYYSTHEKANFYTYDTAAYPASATVEVSGRI